MLARERSADVDAVFEHFLRGQQDVLHLLLVAIVVEEDRVHISIAGVENVVDLETPFLADLVDALQHLAELAARNARVLRAVAGADLADGAEGAFARLPELGARFGVAAGLDTEGAVALGDLDDL